MPLYETVMQEKPPIVLDIGNAYTKLGFAGEAHPRKIIPTEVILSASGGVSKNVLKYDKNNSITLHDQLVEFLLTIFFKHLLVSPKERKIVIVENIFGETTIRETLAKVLFVHFDLSTIMFVPSHMIALSTLAIPSAVVIDIGYCETTVLPVYSGVQILPAFKDQGYGGHAIHEEIKRQLIAAGARAELLTDAVLEDIKVRACFVTTFERAQAYQTGVDVQSPPDIEYPICDEDIIIVPGRTRETAFEIMFDKNHERDSLPHLILRSILDCSIDIRRTLVENILIIGGSAMIMGLLARLKDELHHLLSNDNYYKTNFHKNITFKFHKTIGKQNFTSWLGGSLCGATDLVQTRSLTKEAYLKNQRVPDWIHLAENRTTEA